MTRSLERIEAELALHASLNEARKRSFDNSLSTPERALEGQRVLALTSQLMVLNDPDVDPHRLVTGSLGCVSSSGTGKTTREAQAKEEARRAAEADGTGLDSGRFYSHTVKGGP